MFSDNFWRQNLLVIYAMAVFILAFFSFFWNYNYPNSSQWDEVYHISSAEKYLTGTMFMESHPPLGKLFIALGEKILEPNTPKSQVSPLGRLCFGDLDWKTRPEIIDKSEFTKVDQISSYPSGFSFCGFRLMPVIFATLSAPLFFFLLFLLVRNLHLSAIFSSLYLFDNALILQARSAMVDSTQIFFVLLALTYFVFKIEKVTGNLPPELKKFFQNKKQNGKQELEKVEIDKLENINKNFETENLSSNNLANNLENEKSKTEKNLGKSVEKILENPTENLAQKKKIGWFEYLILGVLCGLSIATKHNAAIILVLPIAWFLFEIWTGRINLYFKGIWQMIDNLSEKNPTEVPFKKEIIHNWLSALIKITTFCIGLIVLYAGVFVVHSTIGQTVVPDNNNRGGYYLTSPQYKKILSEKQTLNPLSWPTMIFGNWKYMQQYHDGVPKLDLCKRDDSGNLSENGSYPMTWPVMNRTISFRWEWGTKDGTPATDNTYIRYSYLIGNPLIWAIGSASILLTLVLILGFLCFNLEIKNRRIFNYILVLTALYLAYMIGVMSVERVMYLYHYLIPLIFTLILAPLLFTYIFGNLQNDLGESGLDSSKSKNSPQNILENENLSENSLESTEVGTELRSSRILEHKSIENSSPNLTDDSTKDNSTKNESFKNSKEEKRKEIDSLGNTDQTKNTLENTESNENLASNLEKNSEKSLKIREVPDYFWHWLALLCGLILVFLCFAFFSPFTYYQPLSRSEFMMRNWFSFWQMRVVN